MVSTRAGDAASVHPERHADVGAERLGRLEAVELRHGGGTRRQARDPRALADAEHGRLRDGARRHLQRDRTQRERAALRPDLLLDHTRVAGGVGRESAPIDRPFRRVSARRDEQGEEGEPEAGHTGIL